VFRKTIIILSFIFCLLLISGCSARYLVNIPKYQSVKAQNVVDKKLGIYFSKAFSNFVHGSTQLGGTFEYPVGAYLQHAIVDSLNDSFTQVIRVESASETCDCDYLIKPSILNFEAPVPPLVTMDTKAKIMIQYEVIPMSRKSPFKVQALGTYEIKDEQDNRIYMNLETSSVYYHDVASGVGVNMPAYTVEAGKDAYMAIHHALVSLRDQLVKKLKDL